MGKVGEGLIEELSLVCVKHLLQACGSLKGFAKVLGEIFSKVYEP